MPESDHIAAPSLGRVAVFLGGHDLEMVEIAKLLSTHPDVTLHDSRLRWGAKASAYVDSIRNALADGLTIVLVELIDDLSAEVPRDRLNWIDHHGLLAGADRPTAIEQVFAMFGYPLERWNRDLALVAANDRGHIAALLQFGATTDEIRDIRARDRRAQGVTVQEEVLARIAIASGESYFGGRLTVVRLPHSSASAATDLLDSSHGGPGYENLLVLCPALTIFFGDGRCIDALRTAHAGSWYGGELPARGYWGCPRPLPLPGCLALLEQELT